MTARKAQVNRYRSVALITGLLAAAPAVLAAAPAAKPVPAPIVKPAAKPAPVAKPAALPEAPSDVADRGEHYLLAKIGFMSIKRNNADVLASLGAVYGIGLSPWWSMEAEANFGLFGGEYTQKQDASVVQTGDYRVATLAGYGVFRYRIAAPVYAKVKAGLLYEHVKRSGTDTDETSNGFGISGGLGLGWQPGRTTTIEGEITGIDRKLVFFSIGFNSAFKW